MSPFDATDRGGVTLFPCRSEIFWANALLVGAERVKVEMSRCFGIELLLKEQRDFNEIATTGDTHLPYWL